MVVDIAPQQQLTEVFTTNHCHHRSSSSSSIHRRSSTTTNNTPSSTLNNNSMTNGHRSLPNELGKKAEQILGHATAILDCRRPISMDFTASYPPRLNITTSNSFMPSRNNISNMVTSTTVNNSMTTTTTSSILNNTVVSNSSSGTSKIAATIESLAPLILKLVSTPKFTKLPERISRRQSNSKSTKNLIENHEMNLALLGGSILKLSDDENEEDDDENIHNTNTVFTETIDNKLDSNSLNQNNSNDNHLPHSHENQIEPQHSGISSSSPQEDGDSDDEDSDNEEAAHSDAENDNGTNETNPDTLSLMDFVRGKEILSEPVNSSFKHSPELLLNTNKRSISPETKCDNDNPVHNCEDHQNKRKKILIKRALLKSFISSVNTKINIKRPSLPIAIPSRLFEDQSLSDSNKQEDDQLVERSQQTSKRYADGLLKHDSNLDVNDGLSQYSSSSLNNQTTINGTHLKKNKTSHVQEKSTNKQEQTTILTAPIEKNEPILNFNTPSTNDLDNKTRPTLLPTTNSSTATSMITAQPKKEKPTANVRPLQQSTSIDNLSSTNSINNCLNISESLASVSTRAMLPATKANYTKLKTMSKIDLASLARKKKKQADHGKRTTFAEVREAMGLYLESVCYFIVCANDEPKQEQRTALLITTLTMLQQLAQNHKKMFHLSNTNQSRDLYSLQQKFLLINYWLQSYIYHLQFNTNMPNIERYANQVTDYFNQLKNPSSAASLTRTTNMNIQQQSTLMNDSNPISPLSTTSQTSSSDNISTTSGNNQSEQHRYIFDFSKLMLNSYYSTYYWNKAEGLMREKPLKEFIEQLLKQNQNRHLMRDDTTLNFIVYIFDAIELLRLSVA